MQIFILALACPLKTITNVYGTLSSREDGDAARINIALNLEIMYYLQPHKIRDWRRLWLSLCHVDFLLGHTSGLLYHWPCWQQSSVVYRIRSYFKLVLLINWLAHTVAWMQLCKLYSASSQPLAYLQRWKKREIKKGILFQLWENINYFLKLPETQRFVYCNEIEYWDELEHWEQQFPVIRYCLRNDMCLEISLHLFNSSLSLGLLVCCAKLWSNICAFW